jgi:hypothetical protein
MYHYIQNGKADCPSLSLGSEAVLLVVSLAGAFVLTLQHGFTYMIDILFLFLLFTMHHTFSCKFHLYGLYL